MANAKPAPRPLGVTLIAAISILWALFVLSNLVLVGYKYSTGEAILTKPLGIAFDAFSIILIPIIYGELKGGMNWAWGLAIVYIAALVAELITSNLTGSDTSLLAIAIYLVVGGYLISYLNKDRVKSWFSAS